MNTYEGTKLLLQLELMAYGAKQNHCLYLFYVLTICYHLLCSQLRSVNKDNDDDYNDNIFYLFLAGRL